ncbi:MAG: DNA polymerase IV [Thaumarchaeota archaeon]|nr:DNA polymerase IV [Nitrososphaerota archaeon]
MPELFEEPSKEKFIVHIDMDSYYASAEVGRDPSLKDKPVVVGADPRNGMGRGVVVACNYPARAFGIRSGMPISQAWRLCRDALYLKPDFAYYERLSGEVMDIIKEHGKKFEQVSIDEAFLDLSDSVHNVREALNLVSEMREEIKRKTGLTSSVGIAESKTAAKIASDLNKPNKVTVVPRGGAARFLATLPMSRIPGVGHKTESLLRAKGFESIGDIQQTDPKVLKTLLGRTGSWLWSAANGLDADRVRERPIRSLGTERTLEEDTSDWKLIEDVIEGLSRELSERAEQMRIEFRKVGIKIRFRGFETHTREKSLPAPTQNYSIIQKEALALLNDFRSSEKKVRLLGVHVSGLRATKGAQVSIESWLR